MTIADYVTVLSYVILALVQAKEMVTLSHSIAKKLSEKQDEVTEDEVFIISVHVFTSLFTIVFIYYHFYIFVYKHILYILKFVI